MNCDRAFELMTNPIGVSDAELTRHLARCPRCRQMQDTLSPALDWFASDAASDWPASQVCGGTITPLLSAQAVQVAETAARDLSHRQMSRGWKRMLAASVLLVCGAAFGSAAFEGPRPAATATSGEKNLMAACLWTDAGVSARLPDSSARSVVASCIVCHVPQSVD